MTNYTVQPGTELDNEIDASLLIGVCKRRWKILSFGTIFVTLCAGIYTLSLKDVWEGSFEIVLSAQPTMSVFQGEKINKLAGTLSSEIANLGGTNELETEVKILESPSILYPVFDVVKNFRSSEGFDTSRSVFSQWRDGSLDIKLEKGTSVLIITYRDTSKVLLLRVLNEISQEYKKYSLRDKQESLSKAIAYTSKKLEEFRVKSAKSSTARDNLSLRYGISSGGPIPSTSISAALLGGIDGQRVARQGDPYSQLAGITQELIRRRRIYTEQDPGIQSLIEEREALKNYIDATAAGAISLPRGKHNRQASVNNIILSYQELDREATRDKITLDTLADSLRKLELQKAREENPWRLISQPTILEKPVSPRMKQNLAVAFISGLMLSMVIAYLVDRKSDLIYERREFSKLIKEPIFLTLSPESMSSRGRLIAESMAQDLTQVDILILGLPLLSPTVKKFVSILKEHFPNPDYKISSDFVSFTSSKNLIILSMLGRTKRSLLVDLVEDLSASKQSNHLWIVYNEE